MRPVASVGVVGTGTMASGIVEVFAKSGYDVVFVARSDEKVAGVRAAVDEVPGQGGRQGQDDRGGPR